MVRECALQAPVQAPSLRGLAGRQARLREFIRGTLSCTGIFDQIMIFHTTGLDSPVQISYTVRAVTLALFAAKALSVIWRRERRGANAT